MRERPIPFSGPMVRALVAGTKTQTRRVVKPQPTGAMPPGWSWQFLGIAEGWYAVNGSHRAEALGRCPYGVPGDRLWVREAFRFPESLDKLSPSAVGEKALDAGYSTPWCPTHYEADLHQTGDWASFGPRPGAALLGKLRPGMFMPRWASRITLEVTEVRVERLHDISEADALAEGVKDQQSIVLRADGSEIRGPVAEYAVLWEQINGPGSWAANPWVWRVSFRRING